MDENKKKISSVQGYVFQSPAEAKRAMQELEYIDKIKAGLSPEDIESMRKLYIKLTAKGYFITPVGISFLHDMRNYLEEQGIDLSSHPIPVLSRTRASGEDDGRKDRRFDEMEKHYEKAQKVIDDLQKTRIRLTVAVIALVVVVVGMLIIAISNENVGYFRTEQKVVDKYAAWEEELSRKEQQLMEWEDSLSGHTTETQN